MFYSNDRQQLRQSFFDAWQKLQYKKPLSPLEMQIAQVIVDHPEYHQLFNHPDKYLDKDYLPEFGETNPFLHLSLHLSIRDQVSTNRPPGMKKIFNLARGLFYLPCRCMI